MQSKILLPRCELEKHSSSTEVKEFITAREAALYLSISLQSLYKLTHKRKFPVYKPGNKKMYIKKEDIDEWVSGSTQYSNKQIEKKSTKHFLK